MSKQRYIQDSFWTDSYIESLSPDGKLIFIYLLTNPQCNIAGVYELRSKRMAFETGYDQEVVENMLKKFEDDRKIIYQNNWIVIVNHLKHQNLGEKVAEGVNRVIRSAPSEIQALFIEKNVENTSGNEYSLLVLDTLSIPYTRGSQTDVNSKVKLSKVNKNNLEEKIDSFFRQWELYEKDPNSDYDVLEEQYDHFTKKKGFEHAYVIDNFEKFYHYWTEEIQGKEKWRVQLKKGFSLRGRLSTFLTRK